MAETFVQLPDDSANTGKLEDHWQLPNSHLREAVVIGDPATAAAVATVTAALGLQVDPKSLPPGASTSAKQDTGNTSLSSIDTKIPASPATTGKQDTGNTSLAAIDTNAGAITDVAVTGDNDGSISAKLRGISKMIADMWDSGNHWLKVSIQNATLAVTQSGTWNVTNVSGTVSLPTGASTLAEQQTQTTALGALVPTTDFDSKIGSLTEAAPGTDTASSGLNGRLQRIAQRITSLITALGSPFQAGGSIGNTTFEATQATAANLKAQVSIASGGVASGAVASGAVASGAFASGSISDGADVTQGAKADAKNSATDTTAITAMSVWKQISFSVQALVTGVVLAAGSAIIGKVGIDQTTKGTTNAISGDTASGATEAGNPVSVGGKAATAAPTAVTAGQRVWGLFDLWGRLHVRNGIEAPVASTWTQVHVPATNTQATKSQASAGSGKRNVCTGFTVTLCGGASAPTPGTPLTVMVVDGATGGTTYLWRTNITMPATAGGIVSFNRSGLWLVGSQATTMTIEFSAGGGTNTYETVSMDGVIIEE